jgi:hypothetical protein
VTSHNTVHMKNSTVRSVSSSSSTVHDEVYIEFIQLLHTFRYQNILKVRYRYFCCGSSTATIWRSNTKIYRHPSKLLGHTNNMNQNHHDIHNDYESNAVLYRDYVTLIDAAIMIVRHWYQL